MLKQCDPGLLSILTAGLAVVNIMSYIQNKYLEEELEKCTNNNIHCKEMSTIAVRNIFADISTFKQYIPADKQMEFLKLEHYLASLAPVLFPETTKDIGIPVYSCGEKYTRVGWPWTSGFIRDNCTKPSIYHSTTIIFTQPVLENSIDKTIEDMLGLFLNIIAVLHEHEYGIMKKLTHNFVHNKRIHIIVIPSRSGFSVGDALNNAMEVVRTPFVFLARNLGRLVTKLDIERLIHVQESTKAAVVSGAVKDIKTGKWDRDCYQAMLKFYTLKYTDGYHISQHECLYCDHLTSSFIARKALLMKHKFRKLNHGVFRDYFMRLRKKGERILSCPDVMFYTKQVRQMEADLVNFAQMWNIRKIVEADNTVLWFGFRAGLKHTKYVDAMVLGKWNLEECGVSPSLAISPDCRDNLLDVLLFLMNLCKVHGITCELEEGTLLGVMKFNNILPWERDADITFLSSEFHMVKKLKDKLTRHGQLKLVSENRFENGEYHGGVFYLKSYGWNIELYGKSKLMKRIKPYTLVKLGSKWVNAPENPGLYSRSRYGREIYKHAEHWRTNNEKHGFMPYTSGKFPQCVKPGHHSCLDQFQADGDLQFHGWL